VDGLDELALHAAEEGHRALLPVEPEFLVSYMDRHDWAVVVCVVGGGQEISTGEAGIDAIKARFPEWHMHISSRLTDSEYGAGSRA
jgi:hypothetical protein